MPHVVWGKKATTACRCASCTTSLRSTGRVAMVPDGDCRVLQRGHCPPALFCRCPHPCDRTAAYSSGVPTLVVGYSVKARGIARDLFGTEDDYVLPVQSLKTPDDLTAAFDWIAARDSRDSGASAVRLCRKDSANSAETGKTIARLLGLCRGAGLAEGIERPGLRVPLRRLRVALPGKGHLHAAGIERGFTRPVVDRGKRIGCGACRTVCPAGQEAVRGTPDTFCAYSRDEEIRQKSSSGGVFTELAQQVLERREGVVVGAAWDRGTVLRHQAVDKHRRTDCPARREICAERHVVCLSGHC